MPTLARSIIREDVVDVDLVRRFWARVATREDGCWQWTGYAEGGYGRFRVGDIVVVAHRFAYELLVGPVPTEFQLDHLCRNRSCVNPGHMEIVTPRVNTLRGESFAAVNAAKTHCSAGHLLAGANLYLRPDRPGTRECRQCSRIAKRAYKARRRSAA